MFPSSHIRHLLALLAAVACASAMLLGYAAPSSGASHPGHHRVRAGETLWSIALRTYPSADPRDAVYRIQQANHLHGAGIVAGRVLVLP